MNKYQTEYTKKYIESLPKEIQEQYYDFITNVPYIHYMLADDRPYARDIPRDSENKIIVDITKPHILEDTDYFRPSAIHYQKYGCFTKLKPNANPNSEYGKWIREEVRRCWEGYIRPSDGEWITGDMYFFLNYCPIQLIKHDAKGKSIRTIDFPNFWDGHYYKFHYLNQCRIEGHHAMELASRGKGKSFCAAAMLAKRFILGESKDVRKKVQCVATASERKYIQGANQLLDMFQYYIDFCANNTEFPRQRITSSLQNLSWTMGYIDSETNTRRGTENSVIGITSKDDESKLRGSRGVLYLLEESGSFPRLLSLYQVLRPSVEDGNSVWGLIFGYGTSGDNDSDFSSMQELMYNPKGYNIKGVDNVYDKEGQGRKQFTYFFPGYLDRADCYDKDGNSDVNKALLEILIDRYNVKYNSTDVNAITKRIAEIPITPQEAILKTRGNIFPITELTNRLNEIDNNPNFYDDTYIGDLVINKKGEVEFTPNTIDKPIREFPTKDNKVKGAIEIFEMPQKINDKIPNERYILSLDNVENDSADTMSLGSIFVLDLWTDRIVAEYTGRPMFADDLNEICRKMCLFYNGKVMVENNKKNTFAYFSRMNSLHLMADTPEYLKNKQLIKVQTFGNSSKGIGATLPIKNFAMQLIKDWLLKPVTVTEEHNNEVTEYTVPNLKFIKNRALIKELMLYNPAINVDRCVFSGTKVLTNNGYKDIQKIKEADLVLTADGNYNKVYYTQNNNFKGIKCRFRALGDYRYLECTDNHPILTCHSIGAKGKYWMKSKYNLSNPEYKRADKLEKDDYILIPQRKNLNVTSISEDLLYLLGWYIADGNVNHNAVRFSLQEDQYEIAKILVNIINKYYKRDYTYIAPKIKNGKIVKDYIAKIPAEAHLNHTRELYKGRVKKMWNVEIHSKKLAEFLTKYGGTANNKTINKELYNCINILPLLRGYFEGDGHYRCEKRCDGVERNSLECSTIYEDLALKIRQLLLDNNIWCTIRKVNMKNSKVSNKPQYNINIVNDNVIPIIKNSLKFKQILPKHSLFKKEYFIKNDYGYWVKIKDFSSEYTEDITYNISVLNNPSYIANGITTHNCMSLCQLMLYREEKMILYQGDLRKTERIEDSSYLGNDPFFNNNYKQ